MRSIDPSSSQIGALGVGFRPKMARPGLTLIELLITISVIALISALGAYGIFTVMGTQRETNTKTTMKAVKKVLDQHVKAVIDAADKETIPASVQALAPDAATQRVILKKLRMKQHFPMTIAEAVAPYAPMDYAFAPNPAPPLASAPPPNPGVNSLSNDFPPLPAYAKALVSAGYAQQQADGTYTLLKGANSVIASGPVPARPFLESSTLLLLALQQKRGTAAPIQEKDLGSYAVDVNADGLKEIVDGWGNPLAFFRFPTGNDDLFRQNPSAGKNGDIGVDPEGKLVDSTWQNWSGGSGFAVFVQMCHNLPAEPPSPYMPPTLVSAGSDGKWGLNLMWIGVNPDMSNITTPSPWNGAPWNMKISDGNDNIYSFRLD